MLSDRSEFERLRREISEAFADQPEDEVRVMVDEAVKAARERIETPAEFVRRI